MDLKYCLTEFMHTGKDSGDITTCTPFSKVVALMASDIHHVSLKQRLSRKENKANEINFWQNETEGKGLAGCCHASTGCFTRTHTREEICKINWVTSQVS